MSSRRSRFRRPPRRIRRLTIFLTSPIFNVVQFGYRLTLIPDELQGRVNSAFRLIAFGGQPLGYALAGVLLQVVGPVTSILLFSIPYVVMAVLTTTNRHVREARPAVYTHSERVAQP